MTAKQGTQLASLKFSLLVMIYAPRLHVRLHTLPPFLWFLRQTDDVACHTDESYRRIAVHSCSTVFVQFIVRAETITERRVFSYRRCGVTRRGQYDSWGNLAYVSVDVLVVV